MVDIRPGSVQGMILHGSSSSLQSVGNERSECGDCAQRSGLMKALS